MNAPVDLFRLVEVFVSGFLSCVRFFTAPLRALSPTGLFTALVPSQKGINSIPATGSRSPNTPGKPLASGGPLDENDIKQGSNDSRPRMKSSSQPKPLPQAARPA